MEHKQGSLGGRRWDGWLVEREDDLPDFTRWVQRQAESGTRVAFDTEGHGLAMYQRDPYLRLAQFGNEDEAWVVPLEHGPAFADAALSALRTLPKLVGHNVINHDGQAVDRHLGFTLEEMCAKTTDTMITAKLIDPRKSFQGGIGAGLKEQSAHYLDPESPDTSHGLQEVFRSLHCGHTKDNGKGWSAVPWNHPTYVEYSMLDVIMGARLLTVHEAELERLGVRPFLLPYEHEVSRVCAIMARAGLLVDEEYTSTLRGDLSNEYEYWADIAAGLGVSSVNKADAVVEALWESGERWNKRSAKTGKLSADAKVLLPMADLDDDWERIGAREPNRLAEAVLRAKRARKWGTTYAERFLRELDGDGLLHPNIQTLEARTGRMSITQPAVQTLPSGDWTVRRCITAGEGNRVISCDFSAVEMRVLAALADVKRMRSAIANGDDLHDFTASLVYGPNFTKHQRTICKRVGLGKIYGAGLDTLVKQTGAPAEQIQHAIKEYNALYPEISRYSQRWQREAASTGYATISATGRRLPVDVRRMFTVVNLQCQSAGRDVLGKALLRMDKSGLLPYLRLPIHDEVLAFAPEADAGDVAREIENCMRFELRGVSIHADADIGGRTWGSLYLKDSAGRMDPELMARHDPYWAAHPEEAQAAAA